MLYNLYPVQCTICTRYIVCIPALYDTPSHSTPPQLNPHNWRALTDFAWTLTTLGKEQEAAAVTRKMGKLKGKSGNAAGEKVSSCIASVACGLLLAVL
jgi:hypothetical protein